MGVLDFAELVGEREAIQRYPALVRAMAAHQGILQSDGAGISELKAHFSIFGWHSTSRIRNEALQHLHQPTLAIWVTTTRSAHPTTFGIASA